MFALHITIGVLLTSFISAFAWAGEVTIEASKDNTLYFSSGGTTSNGRGTYFFVGTTRGGDVRRGLIAFDVAQHIPKGASIESVTLDLNMSRTRTGNAAIRLHRLLNDWGEGASDALGGEGGGAAAAEGDATWLHTFSPSMFWTSPGGDFSATASATAIVGGPGVYRWGTTTQMEEDVQLWLDTPAANFGWLLQGPESVRSAKRFDTREDQDASDRPLLTVTFTAPSALTVGTAAGNVAQTVAADDQLQLNLNTSNDDGLDASQLAMEWFVLFARVGGTDLGIFLFTTGGLIAFDETIDLNANTFVFDHGSGDVFPVGTFALSELGMVSGDLLILAYAYSPTDASAIVIENTLTLTVD
jgi:hypothetical protein